MEVNLVFVTKNGTTQLFPLPSAVTFIGRRQDCDLCIPLSVVSRRHSELFTEFNKVIVRDLKSRNGTFVNDEPVEEKQIKAGDILRIGPVKFVVQIDGVPDSFAEYLPSPAEVPAESVEEKSSDDDVQEVDFDDLLDNVPESIAGQSQTMDIDSLFNNEILGDDGIDPDSEL